VLQAVRIAVSLLSIGLLAAVLRAALAYFRLPPARRRLRPRALVAFTASYGALLVAASALTADLARERGEFHWYAAPLLSGAVLAGWAGVLLMLRSDP